MRAPLRELNLQPGAVTSPGKRTPICSSLSPSLCKLGLQEDINNSSPLASVSAKSRDSFSEQFSNPSTCLEVCQHESAKQHLDLIPLTISTPNPSEEAVDLQQDNLIKTTVLVPPTVEQQQEVTFGAHLDTMAETSSISLDQSLKPKDLLKKGVTSYMEDSFSEFVPDMLKEATFQDPPFHLLDHPPDLCSEQQLHCAEDLVDSKAGEEPEDLVLFESNAFLPSSMRLLSPSPALATDFPVSQVDPGEETVEHRAVEEREVTFPTLPEEAKLGDSVLVSNVEGDTLTANPGVMETQAIPGPVMEDAGRSLVSDTVAWMSPLSWLEKGVNTSVMLENLRQSLSLPAVLRDAATGTTPLSTCSVGTWFTPPTQQKKSSDTSQKGLVDTKGSTSETEHLCWSCPPDLTALSRRDLEDNLLNSLVILEVLSHQLRDWKSQLTDHHLEVQDSSTQTDSSPNGQSWVRVSKELLSLLHLSLLQLEEDKTTMNQESGCAETLVSCFDVLKKLRAKLQSLKTEREEAKQREEVTLRSKAVAETMLETFCAQTSQRINQLEQDLVSSLLKETQNQLAGLHTEQEELAQQIASFTSVVQQDWISMRLDYVTWTALLNRSRELSEKLIAKSRQTLQECDAATEEKQKVSMELEQVSTHLEDCKSQIEQLKLENSRLATDFQAQLQVLSSTENQLKELQSQHAHCTQDLADKDALLCQLTQSNEEQAAEWQKKEMALEHVQTELQQQQAVLAKEVHDLKETLEFADQENQVTHLELGQVECQLKSTLELLLERNMQCEDLKDTVENLKAKLASTIAENQERDLEKTRQYSQGLGVLTKQLQNLTLFLQTKLQDQAEPENLLRSTACSPAPKHSLTTTDSGLLGSMLTTAEPEPAPVSLVGSDKSAFTRVASVVSLQPTETPGIDKSLAEMSARTQELQSLCSLLQESKEEAIRTLKQKICDLQAKLQAEKEQHQEAQKTKETDIEKLNQALCLRYKNEKELQEVIQQQNEKILEQIDKDGELISLREEVTQLTRSLRRAETETKVFQETLASQVDPNCQPMATGWIQEKVWLYQEVDKLRAMLLEMKNEKEALMTKFQSHRNILEENLRRSDKELKKLDDIVQHIYETLLSIPEIVKGCKKLQELLEFLS